MCDLVVIIDALPSDQLRVLPFDILKQLQNALPLATRDSSPASPLTRETSNYSYSVAGLSIL